MTLLMYIVLVLGFLVADIAGIIDMNLLAYLILFSPAIFIIGFISLGALLMKKVRDE